MTPIFVTGIDTDVGKTVVAAILVQSLGADYWKPIQAGDLDRTDTDVVRQLVSTPETTFHPEAYRLDKAASPHASAREQGVAIDLSMLSAPATNRPLVIEGAGGVHAPLSDVITILDLIVALEPKVIVVSKHYLGSINHTLLTLEALERRSVDVAGLVFNGAPNSDTEGIIAARTGVPVVGRLEPEAEITAPVIAKYAHRFGGRLLELV